MLVNVHLFYGWEAPANMRCRSLETFGVAKWAQARQKGKVSFRRNIFATGDFNMPKNEQGDPVRALTKLCFEPPADSSKSVEHRVGQSLRPLRPDRVLPGREPEPARRRTGIFDYDGAIFPALWKNGTKKGNVNAYRRYYISDHQPMWIQLRPA